MDDQEEVFQAISYLDDRLSAEALDEVDQYLADLKIDEITNAALLLGVYNYVYIAEQVGDTLLNGPAFRTRARARLVTLVGEERTKRLLQHRGG